MTELLVTNGYLAHKPKPCGVFNLNDLKNIIKRNIIKPDSGILQ